MVPSGSPHVLRAPMGVCRVARAGSQTESNWPPLVRNWTVTRNRYGLGFTEQGKPKDRYASRAVQFHPRGWDSISFGPPHVRPMGVHRTFGEPHGAYVWCLTA